MNLVKDTIIGNIADDWVLGEFSKDLKIQGRIGWKGYTTSDLVESGPIVVGGTEIKSKIYLNLNNVKHLSREKYVESPEIMLKDGDVLLVTRGNLGEVGYYHSKYGEGTINPSVIVLKDFKGDSKYLFYYLISKQGNHQVLSLTSGSSIPAIYQSEVNTLLYPKPPLQEQKAIAKVLTAFDDKIELLQQQNKTLETIAQTIFKEWFGKYQVGDELPEGWRVGKIGDIVEIKRGGSPRPIKDYISDSGYRWLKISDATATDSPYIFEIKEHIKIEGLKKTTLKKVGDLVLSNSATPGMPKFLAVESCVHDGWMHFPSSLVSNEFLYLLFLNIRPRLVQQGSGSVFVNLKTDILRYFEIIIPSKSVFLDFDNLVKPIFDKIYKNAAQIQSLTKTRDTLLPKLMSGQVRVKNLKEA